MWKNSSSPSDFGDPAETVKDFKTVPPDLFPVNRPHLKQERQVSDVRTTCLTEDSTCELSPDRGGFVMEGPEQQWGLHAAGGNIYQ